MGTCEPVMITGLLSAAVGYPCAEKEESRNGSAVPVKSMLSVPCSTTHPSHSV